MRVLRDNQKSKKKKTPFRWNAIAHKAKIVVRGLASSKSTSRETNFISIMPSFRSKRRTVEKEREMTISNREQIQKKTASKQINIKKLSSVLILNDKSSMLFIENKSLLSNQQKIKICFSILLQ